MRLRVLTVALLAARAGAETPPPQAVMAGLRSADMALRRSTLTVQVRMPALEFDDGQGFQVATYRVTGDGSARALSASSAFPDAPKYHPPDFPGYQPFDFDGDRLILWRTLRWTALDAPEGGELLMESESALVEPSGQVTDRRPFTRLFRFAAGASDMRALFRQVEMGLGHGFGERMEGGLEVLAAAGQLEVSGRGNLGPGLKGSWRLTIEPASWLVRHAVFVPEGAAEPALESHSDGASGAVRYRRAAGWVPEATVELRNRSAAPDPVLLDEARTRVRAPLPAGGAIDDRRRR